MYDVSGPTRLFYLVPEFEFCPEQFDMNDILVVCIRTSGQPVDFIDDQFGCLVSLPFFLIVSVSNEQKPATVSIEELSRSLLAWPQDKAGFHYLFLQYHIAVKRTRNFV